MAIETDRLIAPEENNHTEEVQDRAIRPRSLDDYVGQQVVCEQMGIFVEAARGVCAVAVRRCAGTSGHLGRFRSFGTLGEHGGCPLFSGKWTSSAVSRLSASLSATQWPQLGAPT